MDVSRQTQSKRLRYNEHPQIDANEEAETLPKVLMGREYVMFSKTYKTMNEMTNEAAFFSRLSYGRREMI
jgi:hypothetical protein